jgi:hypothetical protein
MKHSKLLFGFITVIGIVFLVLVLVSAYLDSVDSISILELLYPSQSGLGLWLLLGGTVLLIAGLMGIGRQHFKIRGKLYTGLVVFVILIFIFYGVFGSVGMMILNAPMFPMRSEITQVTIVDADPLVLSLGVKAITCRDSRIDIVFIFDSDRNTVAEYCMEDIVVLDEHGYPYNCSVPICVLSGGSSMTLTVRFNRTLSPGNYTVSLASGGFGDDNHGSSPFTIP